MQGERKGKEDLLKGSAQEGRFKRHAGGIEKFRKGFALHFFNLPWC